MSTFGKANVQFRKQNKQLLLFKKKHTYKGKSFQEVSKAINILRKIRYLYIPRDITKYTYLQELNQNME